jgi:hypothetical protein
MLHREVELDMTVRRAVERTLHETMANLERRFTAESSRRERAQ